MTLYNSPEPSRPTQPTQTPQTETTLEDKHINTRDYALRVAREWLSENNTPITDAVLSDLVTDVKCTPLPQRFESMPKQSQTWAIANRQKEIKDAVEYALIVKYSNNDAYVNIIKTHARQTAANWLKYRNLPPMDSNLQKQVENVPYIPFPFDFSTARFKDSDRDHAIEVSRKPKVTTAVQNLLKAKYPDATTKKAKKGDASHTHTHSHATTTDDDVHIVEDIDPEPEPEHTRRKLRTRRPQQDQAAAAAASTSSEYTKEEVEDVTPVAKQQNKRRHVAKVDLRSSPASAVAVVEEEEEEENGDPTDDDRIATPTEIRKLKKNLETSKKDYVEHYLFNQRRKRNREQCVGIVPYAHTPRVQEMMDNFKYTPFPEGMRKSQIKEETDARQTSFRKAMRESLRKDEESNETAAKKRFADIENGKTKADEELEDGDIDFRTYADDVAKTWLTNNAPTKPRLDKDTKLQLTVHAIADGFTHVCRGAASMSANERDEFAASIRNYVKAQVWHTLRKKYRHPQAQQPQQQHEEDPDLL